MTKDRLSTVSQAQKIVTVLCNLPHTLFIQYLIKSPVLVLQRNISKKEKRFSKHETIRTYTQENYRTENTVEQENITDPINEKIGLSRAYRRNRHERIPYIRVPKDIDKNSLNHNILYSLNISMQLNLNTSTGLLINL